MMRSMQLIFLSLIAGTILTQCSSVESLFEVSPSKEEALPNWSPDGEYIAYECYIEGPVSTIAESNRTHYTQEAADICTIRLDEGRITRLTEDRGAERYPVWSPDGLRIAYTRRDGIYIIDADGMNKRRLVFTPQGQSPEEIGKVAWSPDGSELLFSACLEGKNRDIYLVEVDSGTITNLTSHNNLQDANPMWTLNGKRIVFWSSSLPATRETCYPAIAGGNSPAQLRTISTDGTEEEAILDSEFYYLFPSVSATGKTAFISDLVSKTFQDHIVNKTTAHLYTVDIDEPTPIKRSRASRLVSWSPNGKYIAYVFRGLKLLEVETGEIHELPAIQPSKSQFHNASFYIEDLSDWSPDNQKVAITVSLNESGFYSEKYIYILDLQNNVFHPLIQD